MAPELSKSFPTFDIPLGELVHSLAMAVAEAQEALDRSSLMKAEFLSGQTVLRSSKTGLPVNADGLPTDVPVVLDSRVFFGHELVDGKRVPLKLSMLELGFTPTFYQFVETVIEVRVALRVNRSETSEGSSHFNLTGTTVDASYASTYSYDLNAAALFKTKLVPIPAPAVLEQRIQRLLEQSKQRLRSEDASEEATAT